MVHAEFGDLAGEQAVFALFADEQGSFEFMLGLPAPRTTIEGGTENLVLEATRRLDEARRDDEQTVDMEMVPGFSEDADGGGDHSLNQSEVALLRLVDGRRSVAEIAKSASIDPDKARTTVQRLLDVGIIKLAGRRPRTARLVTRISSHRMTQGTAGIDPSIMNSWQKALGYAAQSVACRRPDGKVCILAVAAVPEAGPFLLITRDTLMQADLVVNQPLLVKPVPRAAPSQESRSRQRGES